MKTILVVDDSKTARLTLKRKLDLIQDVHVEMADSGETAIELLNHGAPPDLIFMDVLMGKMSGYEATATILKNPIMADVPIVMCTSKDSQEDRDEAARNGAKGFIIKPITDEALDEVLRNLVLNRIPVVPTAAQATPAVTLPADTPPTVTEAQETMPQFVITDEFEDLVRKMVEQSNLHRAEEAAGQVVHAALAEHLHQVEDILEGKISILTSSLAALHSAQEQAQAEFQNELASIPKADKPVDDVRIAALVTQQLTDFEAQEHSKRALHELDLQTRLEQALPQLAEQSAQNVAERLVNQALSSPQKLPPEWMQQLITKQDEMLEQRFNAWNAQMDALIKQQEHAMFERIDEKMNALALQTSAEQIAAEKPHAHAATQKQDTSTNKIALGLAALGVVLALIALMT